MSFKVDAITSRSRSDPPPLKWSALRALPSYRPLPGTKRLGQSGLMTSEPATYPGYRFPAEIISHAVWLYHVFGLSFRDAELLLAERGITVTHEGIAKLLG